MDPVGDYPPGGHPAEKITRTANPVRHAFHGLICVLGWVAFVWYLYAVLLRPLERDAVFTFLLLVAYGACIAMINEMWIRFNSRLSRRLARRQQPRLLEFTATADKIGRRLEGADWSRLRQTSHIWIQIDEATRTKRYRADSPDLEP